MVFLLSSRRCGADDKHVPAHQAGVAQPGLDGTIAVITVDPSHPYWKADANTSAQTVVAQPCG